MHIPGRDERVQLMAITQPVPSWLDRVKSEYACDPELEDKSSKFASEQLDRTRSATHNG